MQKLPILTVVLGTSLWLGVQPVGAQTADEERLRLDEIARVAAQQFIAAREAEQTRPTTPNPPAGTVVELTLEDVTTRALERNLELAVERLNPQTFDFNIARIRALYRPTFTSMVRQNSQVQVPTSTLLNGGFITQNDRTDYNTGFTQLLPWLGGNVNLAFNNNKQVTNSNNANYNPAYNTTFAFTYTQPLLRGFLIDTNRQQLRVTGINRDISDAQLRGVIATTLAAVRNAYFELLYAIEAANVAKGSLTLAEKLVEDNRSRVEIGTMAPLDVVQAEAEVATRRQAVAQTEATMRTSELALKRLIVNGTDDPLWRSTLNPIDRPVFDPQPLDVERAVRTSLENRTDLEQARLQVRSNNVTYSFLRNQTLPAVDLQTSYGAAGLGGVQIQRQGGQVINTVPGGYGNAFSALTARDFPNWSVQVNLSYPIGGSAAQAQYARARVQLSQAAAQLRALELQVATDVTNAALQVENGRVRYEAALAARQLAETRLQAEQSRFDVGLTTNFFVVQAQRDLSTAQNSELRALLDYRRALVDFQRVQEAPAGGRGGGITTVN